MFARVHTSTELKGGNTGSCFSLTKYLDKEAEQENVEGKTLTDRETSSRLVHYLDKEEGNHFFTSQPGRYDMGEVITQIDNNRKNLGVNDTKFYMLTLNPSTSEQKHLIGEDIENFHSLSKERQDEVKQKLVAFTRSSMDAYARNFDRPNITCGDDLLYFARIETQRTYKKDSEEVRQGKAKIGDLKSGLNLHVHIIVSRNSRDQRTKLSPHVKSKGNTWELNGKEVKRGFNHEKWKLEVQQIFNDKFNYTSKEDSYKSVLEEKEQLKEVQNLKLTGEWKDFKKGSNVGNYKGNNNKINRKTLGKKKGSSSNYSMGSVAAKLQNKAKKEILKDNFQTERILVGQTNMLIKVIKNPKSIIKQTVINEIKNLLNPLKEL